MFAATNDKVERERVKDLRPLCGRYRILNNW